MEKAIRYKKGFVLGKFLPPHAGHLHLINSAKQQVDELTVLVCTIQREPIDGLLRYQWMKALLPDVNVVHVTDEVPSYPHEHPDFWDIWRDLLLRNIDADTEVFFSSELYGDEVADLLGIAHVNIDQPRSAVPVSGSAIRENPLENWQYIPDVVRPYFLKRIAIVGPESTGKTVMAEQLAKHYETNWVREYGREYFVEAGGKLVLDDIIAIAKGQLQLEDIGAKDANKLLICDTDLIVTKVWSEIYFNSCSEWVEEAINHQKYDLYLLLDIDIPWDDDGTREFPHLRQWHFDRLKGVLNERGCRYVIISGLGNDRLQQAISAIDVMVLQS